MPVVESSETEAKEPLVVARVEIPERRGVTGLTPLDEHAIALEVHIVAEARQLFFTERQLLLVPSPSVCPLTQEYVTLCRPVAGFL